MRVIWGDTVYLPGGEQAEAKAYIGNDLWYCSDGNVYQEDELELVEDDNEQVREH